ncbi:MAG: flippase-like domain-containing protein [Acidobacteria bacterium]|nr:flippase-like domain-containing protein [Acidobacteriota bacterium]MBI3656435.1 flippase-like domain-containing protein [Acidobacteriota bacterium]
MKAKLLFVLKLVVMVLLFAVVARKIDGRKFYEVVRHAHVGYLALAAMTIWVGHITCMARWRILLDVFRISLRYSRMLAIYSVAIFAGIFLPSTVGGDVLKFYLTGRETKRSYTMAFASVFMDRNLGLSILVFLAFIFTLIQPVSLNGIPMLPLTASLTLGFLVVNFVLFYPGIHAWVSRLIARRLPTVVHRLDVLSDAFVSLYRSKGAWHYLMIFSILNHFSSVVVAWLIALSLGVHIPFIYFLVFVPIMNLVATIPLTPMGIGLREGTLLGLFKSVIHLPDEKGLAIGSLLSVLMVLTSLPGGIFYLTFKRQGEMEGISEATTAV